MIAKDFGEDIKTLKDWDNLDLDRKTIIAYWICHARMVMLTNYRRRVKADVNIENWGKKKHFDNWSKVYSNDWRSLVRDGYK